MPGVPRIRSMDVFPPVHSVLAEAGPLRQHTRAQLAFYRPCPTQQDVCTHTARWRGQPHADIPCGLQGRASPALARDCVVVLVLAHPQAHCGVRAVSATRCLGDGRQPHLRNGACAAWQGTCSCFVEDLFWTLAQAQYGGPCPGVPDSDLFTFHVPIDNGNSTSYLTGDFCFQVHAG